jgi:hypothetical protein
MLTSFFSQYFSCHSECWTACDPQCATLNDTTLATGCNKYNSSRCDDYCKANYIVQAVTHFCASKIPFTVRTSIRMISGRKAKPAYVHLGNVLHLDQLQNVFIQCSRNMFVYANKILFRLFLNADV